MRSVPTGTTDPSTNTPADDSLAVYLASVEDIARRHHAINEHHALALIGHLRQYMAHAETIERSVEAMSKSLGGYV